MYLYIKLIEKSIVSKIIYIFIYIQIYPIYHYGMPIYPFYFSIITRIIPIDILFSFCFIVFYRTQYSVIGCCTAIV